MHCPYVSFRCVGTVLSFCHQGAYDQLRRPSKDDSAGGDIASEMNRLQVRICDTHTCEGSMHVKGLHM